MNSHCLYSGSGSPALDMSLYIRSTPSPNSFTKSYSFKNSGSSRFSVGWALLCKDARTESHGFCKHHGHNAYKRTMLTNAPSSPHSPRSPSPRKAHNPASAACNGASNGAAGYAFRHPGVTDARIQTVSERLERPDRPERPESPEQPDVQL